MNIDDLKMTISEISENRKYLDPGMGEEATKQTLIIPMIKALGYNPHNPREVRPEFEADFRDKKKGQKCKVDYAIFVNEQPTILIEAKSIDESLEGHEGQIRDYFAKLPQTRLGILTNGILWQFFTDTKDTNICDSEPFFSFDLRQPDDKNLRILQAFHKSKFNAANITDFGSELKYTALMTEFLSRELDIRDGELSDNFLKWILQYSKVYEGRLVSSVLDRFRSMGKIALQNTITRIVRRSLSAIDDSLRSEDLPPKEEPDTIEGTPTTENAQETLEVAPNSEVRNQPKTRGIETTEEELAAFEIYREIFDQEFEEKEIFEPSKRKYVKVIPGFKDTTTYFGVYINKPSWWIMRLSLDSKIKWVGFNLEDINDEVPDKFTVLPGNSLAPLRVVINTVEDLLELRDLIVKAVNTEIINRTPLDALKEATP